MIFARRQAQSLERIGVEVREFFLASRTSPFAMTREMRRFRKEIAHFRPDVVHAHFGTATAIFAALGARGIPLVITYRGSDLNPSEGGIRSFCGRLLSQIAALAAARIVCVSSGLRDRLWWRKSRAIVAPSGVDIDVFQPRPKNAARERLGWPQRERVVLFNAGSNPKVKRLDLAMASVAIARREIPELRLHLLDGNTPPDLIPQLMNASDCLLVTSDSEGSPTVVQEALASDLAVVSVDVGDVAERIRGVQNARLVMRDPAALARAIVELVRTPPPSGGRATVHDFCSHRIAEKLRDLYREACGSDAAMALTTRARPDEI